MNLHTAKPACHTEHGYERRAMPSFRDDAQVCYATDGEIARHTPGCAGCGRRAAK